MQRSNRSRLTTALLCTAALGSVLAAPAMADEYVQVIPFSTINPAAGDGNLSGVALVGGSFVFTNAFSNSGTNSVIEGPAFTTLASNTDIVLAGGDSFGLDPGQFYANSATTALLGDRRADAIFSIDVASDTLTQVASETDITNFTGASSAGVSDQVIDSNGNLVFYDSASDSLISATSAGVLSTIASDSDLTSGIGNDTTNGLTASPTMDILFFGDDGNDEIYSLDYSGVSNVYSTVLTNAQIASVTGDLVLQVDNMLFAPDGQIYFYDGRTDSIYSFDPTDAANTLALVIDDTALLEGPGKSDVIGGLVWVDGNIGWTVLRSNANTGAVAGLYAVPEPSSLALLGLGGLLAARRRRR